MNDRPGVVRTALSGAQHGRTGQALRKLQGRILGHDKDAPKRNHQQNAQQSAAQGDEGGEDDIKALPHPNQDQGWHGKDNPGGQRLPGRGGRLSLVGFENRPATQHDPQEQHGQDRSRDRSRDGHADSQPQVDVGRAHDDRQDQTDEDGPQGQFRRVGCLHALSDHGRAARFCSTKRVV